MCHQQTVQIQIQIQVHVLLLISYDPGNGYRHVNLIFPVTCNFISYSVMQCSAYMAFLKRDFA